MVFLASCSDPSEFHVGRGNLRELSRYTTSIDVWTARAKEVRQGIVEGASLSLPPRSAQLNTVISSLRIRAGYSVENVSFEAVPGFYVTGNLYRPLGRQGKVPAILHPHGHFRTKGWYARTAPEVQRLSSTLATLGAVVFAYDMVGWGDSRQTSHDAPDVLALQLRNSIRSIDFLETLPEVDPKRIGIVGASGGGTQAVLATAVDDRIAVSAPLVMISSAYDGGDGCESGMPIREATGTNNVEIAATAAPRPQLLVSVGHDWTKMVPWVDMPYLRRVYGLFGAENDVTNVHLTDEGHDLAPRKRWSVYRFFFKHLGLDLPLAENTRLEAHESLIVSPGAPRSDQERREEQSTKRPTRIRLD